MQAQVKSLEDRLLKNDKAIGFFVFTVEPGEERKLAAGIT